MPTVAKSSGSLSTLGDISTFDISTAAVPYDTADSSGSVPTFRTTFADGKDSEFLIGETLTLSAPSIGTYSGKIVSHDKAANSNKYNLDTNTILARLNIDQRLYPLADYAGTSTTWIPLYALEYWTQQCGLFYTDIPGDVLFYQSQYGHFGAYCKGITRPVRSQRPTVSSDRSTPTVLGDRVVVSFGRNSTSTLKLPVVDSTNPTASYLPMLVPPTGSPERLVFGVNLFVDGTSRRGTVTWHLISPNGKKVSLRVLADSEAGISMYLSNDNVTYTLLGTVSTPKGVDYTALIGVSQFSATEAKLEFRVMHPNSAQLGNVTTTVTTPLIGSLSLYQVTYNGEDVGTGNPLLYSNTFVSQMKNFPSAQFPVLKSLSNGPKATSFLVGFSGNVWEHIKQYCSIYHLDVSYRNGKLTIGPRQRDIKVGASLSELSTSVQAREQARFVEVVNQQHKPTGPSPVVLWSADTVYQVAVGEIQEVIIQTKHSILEVTQPVCVSGITPFPYTVGVGQYVVTGSDGYIVSPTFWADQGGKVTAETTETEGEIKITIKGPDFDSSRAPYRISEGDAGRPALYISGLGVLADPKTLKVSTGNNKAAKDVGVTIDSPFISDAKLAFDAAARASREFTVPSMTTTIAEPIGYDEASTLGQFPAGTLVKKDGNIMRVVSASQNHSVMSGSAQQHNTIYQLKRSFGTGGTIGEMNDYNAGKTIGKVNLKPIKKVLF